MLISQLIRRSIPSKRVCISYCYCTQSPAPVYTEKNERELAEIERKRNKSRMQDHHRNLMEDNLKMPEIRFTYQLETYYKRRQYAKFGRASGIDPSVMWPTKKQLDEMHENDKMFEPPLQEMMERVQKARQEESERIKQRELFVERNMSRLDGWLDDLRKRKNKKLAAAQAVRDKREQVIEEVRQYFGYQLSPKDPKFQEVLEKKEKEEKKLAKEAKKQDKFAREMAKLASLAQKTSLEIMETASTKDPKDSEKATESKSSEDAK